MKESSRFEKESESHRVLETFVLRNPSRNILVKKRFGNMLTVVSHLTIKLYFQSI